MTYDVAFWACVLLIAGLITLVAVSPEFAPVVSTGRRMD